MSLLSKCSFKLNSENKNVCTFEEKFKVKFKAKTKTLVKLRLLKPKSGFRKKKQASKAALYGTPIANKEELKFCDWTTKKDHRKILEKFHEYSLKNDYTHAVKHCQETLITLCIKNY